MARALVTAIVPTTGYPALPVAANSLDMAGTAADVTNFNMTPLVPGKTMLLAHNTHASTAYTATVESVVDERGRTGDIGPYTMQAGEIACLGIFSAAGWKQPSDSADPGALYFKANNAAVEFIVITLP